MKLLIVTQKADRSDPILGFFHQWLVEFSAHTAALTVIGQAVGDRDLPPSVQVYSMGKEQGVSRLTQIVRFWGLIWRLRGNYDRVLVHMTPVWIVLGAPLWLLLRKRMFLWYEARGGGWALPVALLFVTKVFHATAYGLPRSTSKSVLIGHGIDTETFTPASAPPESGLLCAIGRITATKHLDVIIRAVAALPSHTRLEIVGGAITPADAVLECSLHDLVAQSGLQTRVAFRGFKSHEQIRNTLQRSEVMLHACGGGLDKVVLEAMACGCPVVTTSVAARGVLPEVCLAEENTLAQVTQALLTRSPQERDALRNDLRERAVNGYGLPRFIDRLIAAMR